MTRECLLRGDIEHAVFNTIEHAHEVTSAIELTELFAPACARLGYSHFATFSVLDPKGKTIGAYEAGSTDPIWNEHYVAQDHFQRDAIVRLLPCMLDAMIWSELTRTHDLAADERLVFNEAREFGHRDGLVLPQHYLDGAIAATILVAPDRIEPNPRLRAAAQILAAYFSIAVRRMMAPSVSGKTVALSRRQRECLQWVRAGKSDWEIGEILGISEHTVSEHIEAARKKLGVRTRTQAVIEAISRKLVSI
ncbi:MAG TPA: hypothetical protein DHW63_00695 [Hyphomonadaceae bacterium]|nr:hypothetical protein [Hyphomonadaceae bacterium]